MENITNLETITQLKKLIEKSEKTIDYLTKHLNDIIAEAKDIPANDKIAKELSQYWIDYYTKEIDEMKHSTELQKDLVEDLVKSFSKKL